MAKIPPLSPDSLYCKLVREAKAKPRTSTFRMRPSQSRRRAEKPCPLNTHKLGVGGGPYPDVSIQRTMRQKLLECKDDERERRRPTLVKARIRRMRHPPLLGRPRPLLRPFILVIDLVEIQTCRMHFSPSPTASHIRHPFQIHTHKCREEDGDDADAQMDWLESSPPAESGQKTRESADSRVGNGASFRRRRRNWREKFCRIGCPISRERETLQVQPDKKWLLASTHAHSMGPRAGRPPRGHLSCSGRRN